MKIDIEYEELLDVTNALRARAEVLERLSAEGLAPDHWQREAAKRRTLAEKLLAQAGAAVAKDD